MSTMLEKEGSRRDISISIGLVLGLTAVVFWIRHQVHTGDMTNCHSL